VVEVGEEAGVGRCPAEDAPGREGGRWVVQHDHRREEPEVRLQAVGRDALLGQAQVVADALGDLAYRDAFVPGRVPPGAGRRVLEGQAVEMTDVEGVPGGPPVRAVPGVAGYAGLPRDGNQGPGEAVTVQRAVGDGRDPHDR
jgi:hypothetical protein